MKIGINFLPDVTPAQMSGEQYLSEALDLTARADEMGFSHVKITEHYLGTYGGYSPSPIAFLAAASQRTRQMRLITGCCLPVFRHPVQLAAELAMLDCLSNGRLEAGFARAWLPNEFEALGVSMDGSRTVFTENISAILKLWTEEKVSWQGAANQFKDVTVFIRPVQKPRPPVWIATTMTPQSYIWAGQQGFRLMVTIVNWDVLQTNLKLYQKAYEEAGHGPLNSENILLGVPVYLAETSEQALDEVARPFRNSQLALAEAAQEWKEASSSDYQYYNYMPGIMEQHQRNRKPLGAEIEGGKLLAGNPEQVYQQLLRIEQKLGISNFSLFFTFGGLEYSKARQSMELFAKYVLPQLPIGSVLKEEVSLSRV